MSLLHKQHAIGSGRAEVKLHSVLTSMTEGGGWSPLPTSHFIPVREPTVNWPQGPSRHKARENNDPSPSLIYPQASSL
jgi:hypothetical protein